MSLLQKDTERFETSVKKSSGCWQWLGVLIKGGYGVMYSTVAKKQVLAHRWAYETFVGEIPQGLTIDHQCNNPTCVNPEHLKAMTQRENSARRKDWMADRTHCPRGHEYTSENTYTKPGSNYRDCRKCISRRTAEYKIRKGIRPNKGMYAR